MAYAVKRPYTIHVQYATDDQGNDVTLVSCEGCVCDSAGDAVQRRGVQVSESLVFDGAKSVDQVEADAKAALIAKATA